MYIHTYILTISQATHFLPRYMYGHSLPGVSTDQVYCTQLLPGIQVPSKPESDPLPAPRYRTLFYSNLLPCSSLAS